MANLFDTIQQNRQQATAQPVPMQDETSKLQRLMRARSGKATGGADGSLSNLGEQAAVGTTNQQLASLSGQAQVQNQQAAAEQEQQQSQEQQAVQKVDQARRFNTAQNNIRTNQILQNLSNAREELGTEKARADMEQASFLLAMGDKQYTDQLQDIGKRRRLDNEAEFRQEMERQSFGNAIDLMKQKLGTNDLLQANDRQFQKAMAEMSLEDAQQIAALESIYAQDAADIETSAIRDQARTQATAANQTAMWQGIGGLVSSGLQGYDVYSKQQKKPTGGTV